MSFAQHYQNHHRHHSHTSSSPSVDLSGEHRPGAPTNAQYKPYPQPAKATAPLVIVEGFLSYTSEFWWGDFATHLNGHRAKVGSKKRREIIFARVGPVNSVHDRACELFYSLKGGRVDYGEEHSREMKHERYGRNYSVGLYPSWSVDHPLHLLGHSMGGVTIVKMITMIREGFFGRDAHPDMIASVNSVGSPFRGTQLGYWMTGAAKDAPQFSHLALSSFLSKYLHLVSYFSPILPSALVPDFHNESRKLTMKDISFFELLKQLWHSDWSEGKDATPWDCTFAAAEARDEEFNAFRRSGAMGPGSSSKTWYRSYVMVYTDRADEAGKLPFHAPSLTKLVQSPPLWVTSLITGGFDLSRISPMPGFLARLRNEREEREDMFGSEEDEDEDLMAVVGEEDDSFAPPHASSSNLVTRQHSSGSSSSASSFESRQVRQRGSQSRARSLFDDDVTLRAASSSSSSTSYSEDDSNRGRIRLSQGLEPERGEKPDHKHLGEHYYANDGVVPLFSQFHPGECDDATCIHYTPLADTGRLPTSHLHAKQIPQPGIWNVVQIEDSHHLSLMPMWIGSKKQRSFWYGLGEWLEEVDASRTFMNIMDGSRSVDMTQGQGHHSQGSAAH